MPTAAKGHGIVSDEEQRMADYLRERNLAHVNKISAEVHPIDSFYTRYGKRVLDLVISIPAFVITLPFNIVFGICTYFDVGRPIFYKQTRIGKDGKPFTLVKFRNMNEKKDADGNLLPASQRVTKYGKIMRKYSLDELLNFWSVVKGDMSIIGPRPYPTFFLDRMCERHKMRHAVRPGLECPRILNDGRELIGYNKEFENAVWYVENISFKTDILMFFKLIKMVFSIKERSKNAGALSYFVGYDDEGQALGLRRAKEHYDNYQWREIENV